MKYICDLNFPSNTGKGSRTVAVLTRAEWTNIEGKLDKPRLQKEFAEATRDKESAKLEKSREMTVHWKNTVTQIQEQREKQRMEAAQKLEEQRVREYKEIMEKRERERQETLERAREIVFERKETCRRVLSGLTLSAVLEERQRQIELRKKLQKEKEQEDAEFAEKVKKAALEYQEDVKNEILKEVKKKEAYKEVVRKQLEENRKNYDQAEKEKVIEKEDMVQLQKELVEEEQQEIKEKLEKMLKFRRQQDEQLRFTREQRQKREQEERELTELNAIYQDVAEKLNQKRKEEEARIRKELAERKLKLQEKVRRESVDYKKEEESYLKAVAEQEERYRKDQQLKKEKEELRKRELIQSEKDETVKNANKAKRDYEKRRWEYLQRLAKTEADAKWKKENEKGSSKDVEEYRQILIEQWKDKDEKELKEKVDDVKHFYEELQIEQDSLIKYCDKIHKYVEEKKWPVYPVTMAIDGAIKSLGIRESTKLVPFLQSKVPISSVAVYES